MDEHKQTKRRKNKKNRLLNSEEIPKGKFLANFFQNTFDPT